MSKATERQEPKSIVEVPWSVVRDKDDKDPKMKQSGARHRAQRVEGCSGLCLGVDLEPDEWIKDSVCSKHMTGNQKLFSTYKDGKVIGRGIRKKGLYVMKLGNKPKDKICLATIDENSTLWHRRLGHANMRLIQSLASKEYYKPY
ncbi:retrovirus-related pol polyprotein from transposon TNT 1-94 [Tanacetum coccineum]